MKAPQKASRAFEAAVERDCTWFQSNPAKTMRRKVTGRELPRTLRGLGIAEVVIELAGPDRFIRTFFDHEGRPVASGIDELKDEVVPGAPGHTINVIPNGQVVVDRDESASRHDFNALNYPILPKSSSASKREFPELPNSGARPPRERNSHIFERERNDLYIEPPWCSARLFDVENFPEPVWDPCCGSGTIPKAARAAGLPTRASDIVDGHDFLTDSSLLAPPFNIVTNPPYRIAREIVERALKLGAAKVAILFPTARVHAAWRWLQPLPLARLYLLTPRPSVPPPTAKVVRGGRVDFCWLVLDRRHQGLPTWRWLRRDERGAT